MRIHQTVISRNSRGDIIQSKTNIVSCLHFREGRSIVRTGTGVDDVAEADLVSATQLEIGDLIFVQRGWQRNDIYREKTVSPSSMGRHQYKLTRKLDDAA